MTSAPKQILTEYKFLTNQRTDSYKAALGLEKPESFTTKTHVTVDAKKRKVIKITRQATETKRPQ